MAKSSYSNPRFCFLIVFFFSLFFQLNVVAQSPGFKINKTPKWVIQPPKTGGSQIQTYSNSAGYFYLLVNNQENLSEQHKYFHHTIKLLNNEGVQEMSDLSFSFDPSYQELHFHTLTITRGQTIINKLNKDDIKLVQREANMDRYMYDGNYTAIINLTDIRSGDIIDYSYSIIGDNPIYEGIYSQLIYLQYSIPVEQLYFHLITPKNNSLQFKYFNGAENPQVSESNNNTHYSWNKTNLKPLIYDINTPGWYNPYPHIQVSGYQNWGMVNQQFSKWYQINKSEQNELKNKMSQLGFVENNEAGILNCIRFVQDEIRYLGFEDGVNSHKPTPPLQVLDQRYGDCKAKSFLLSEMLNILKVEAYPVLVHSYHGHTIGEYLPTPDAFNHVVLKLTYNQNDFFVDPTYGNQGGDLEHLYFPNYESGLILNTSNTGLDRLPFRSNTLTQVHDIFQLEEVGKGANLIVKTVYQGEAADQQRDIFLSQNMEEIQNNYVNFYSRLYPTIHFVKDISIQDNREGVNQFIVEETYRIDSIWTISSSNPNMLVLEFYPLTLNNYVTGEKSPKRTMPYDITFPVNIEHRIQVNLVDDWNLDEDAQVIQNTAFDFNYEITKTKKTIDLVYKFKTLKDNIEATEVDEFISKLNFVSEQLTYFLTYDTTNSKNANALSWFSLVLCLFIALGFAYYCWYLFKKYDVEIIGKFHKGIPIGGWLILLSIGLVLVPLQLVFQLISNDVFFTKFIWISLGQFHTNSYNGLLALLILFELIYNVVFFVFSILVIFLLFNRRTSFPKMAIIMLLASLLVLIFDSIMFELLCRHPLSTASAAEHSYKEIVQRTIYTAVWVPYLYLSERVQDTFVYLSKENQLAEDMKLIENEALTKESSITM